MPTRHSLVSRRAGVAAVALVGAAAVTLAGVPSAAAATKRAPAPVVSVANGAVGVPQSVSVLAPGSAGTTVSVQLSLGGTVQTQQPVSLNAQGVGGFTWTPTASGTWTVAGLAGQSGYSVAVAPTPTRTSLFVPNQVQAGTVTVLEATVRAAGSYLPAGTVTFTNAYTGEVYGTAAVGGTSAGTATGRISWTAPSPGGFRLTATYASANGSATGSSSTNTSTIISTPQLVSLLVPPTFTYGQQVTLTTRVNSTLLQGGVATWVDANGVVTNLPQGAGVIEQESSATWTPSTLGNQLVYASFSPTNSSQTGTTVQWVSVQPAPPADALSVLLGGRGPLSTSAAITVTGGSRLSVAGSSGSGASVTFAATGPCYLLGSTLVTPASGGTCGLIASSTGAAGFGPSSAGFTITVTRAATR